MTTVNNAIDMLKGRRGDLSPEAAAFQRTTLHLMTQGKPVSAEQVAEATGYPLKQVGDVFAQIKEQGCEFNDKNELVGMALTQNPTTHGFKINGQQLYAWCALDTLFLPAFIGQTAQVESTCPVTGEVIRITVTPEGIASAIPEDVALSIVTDACCTAGPQGSFCGRIFFFASAEVATQRAADSDDVSIFTLNEAYQVARGVYIEPFLKMLTLHN